MRRYTHPIADAGLSSSSSPVVQLHVSILAMPLLRLHISDRKICSLTFPIASECFLLSLCLCTHAVGTSSDRGGGPSCGHRFDFSFSSLDTLPPAIDTHLSPKEIRGGSFQSACITYIAL
eukprot:scaffold17881_cov148-Skeletonema_dohrnii-CCMP3373.AAC.11